MQISVNKMVSVLFAESSGIYSEFKNVDLWGALRDARKYRLDNPVVCHPPCQLWGKFAKINYKRWGGEHNRPGNDKGCFEFALQTVRRCGGVLEHPAFTYAWGRYGIPKPEGKGWNSVGADEYVCEVWQSAYGHLAQKRTWLLYIGKRPHELKWDRVKGTHQIGFPDQRGKLKNKPTLSGKKASATPRSFAEELIKLAKNARG